MPQSLKSASEARIIRIKQVKERTGLSRSTLYTLIKEGKFAPPIPIGARCVGWLSSDIDAWIESRIKASRTNPFCKFK
jgi:prophage regulatory protein